MNARGLMELILLNIGLQHGIITPTLFTIMVIMAVVTTLMASPLFEWVYRKLPKREMKISPAH
jgi:Kef-type K+ transport system membrane component KefB